MDKNGCTIFPESSGMDFEKLSENRVPLSGIKMDRKMSVETTAFVILHYGSQDVTNQCVRSVLRMDHQESVQIIIVDNEIQKPEADRAKLKATYQGIPNITVLMIHENGGFSYANNQGYRYAREQLGEAIMLVLNNDIEFTQKDFLQQMVQSWKKDPCHIIGIDIIRKSTGEHQNPMDTRLRTREEAEHTIRMNHRALKHYQLLYPLLYWNFCRLQKAATAKRRDDAAYASAQKDIVPFGACLIFTPDFLKSEQLAFTPETHFYYEEYILANRCRQKGYHIHYVPTMKVWHESGKATEVSYRKEKEKLRFVMERTAEACEVYLRTLS